jgi:hypothetical protein
MSIRNFFVWGWRLKDEASWEIDYGFYKYMYYKLGELLTLIDGGRGHLVWQTKKKQVRKLRRAKEMAGRLAGIIEFETRYDNLLIDNPITFKRNDDRFVEVVFGKRPTKLETKESLNEKERQFQQFMELLTKHIRSWWD